MVYDVGTRMLTVAGGVRYSKCLAKSYTMISDVWQLPELTDKSNWIKLPYLNYPASNPMMVYDDQYLYVLGGDGFPYCERLSKNNPDKWELLDPLLTAMDVQVEYSGGDYSGAFVYDNKVRVLTRSKFHILDGRSWTSRRYTTDQIEQLTPILHKGDIVACVRWKQPSTPREDPITIEKLELDDMSWVSYAITPPYCEIGAGRIASFNFQAQ